MSSALEINGKSLYLIKDAVSKTTYSRDYVTRLAREGKIVASHIGRQWFVDVDSLKAYAEASALEQEIRKKQLSAERIRERRIHEAAELHNSRQSKRAQSVRARSLVAASFVLGLGLLGGATLHSTLLLQGVQISQVASTQQIKVSEVVYSTESEVSSSELATGESTLPVDKFDGMARLQVSDTSFDIRSLGDAKGGVLLLPQATSTIEELFSDRVIVQELEDGTEVVARVDTDGRVLGNMVPFVQVPVDRLDI